MYYFIFLIIIAQKVVYSAHIVRQGTLNDGNKIISEDLKILPHRQRKIKDYEVEGPLAYEDDYADSNANLFEEQVHGSEEIPNSPSPKYHSTSVNQIDFRRSNFGTDGEFPQFEIQVQAKRTPLPEFPQFPSLLKVVQIPKPKINTGTNINPKGYIHFSTTGAPSNKKAREGSKVSAKSIKSLKRKQKGRLKNTAKITTPHLPYYIKDSNEVIDVTIEDNSNLPDSIENINKRARDSNPKITKSVNLKVKYRNQQDDEDDELQYRGHLIKLQKDNPQPLKCKIVVTNIKATENKDYDDNVVPRATTDSDKTDFVFYPLSDNIDENSYKIRNLIPGETIKVAVHSTAMTEEPNFSQITPIDPVYDERNSGNAKDSLQTFVEPATSSSSNGNVDFRTRDIPKINEDLNKFSLIPSTPQAPSSQYVDSYKSDDDATIESMVRLSNSHKMNDNTEKNLDLENYENAMHQRCDIGKECKKIGYQFSKPPKKHKHKSSKCHPKVRLSTPMTEEPNLSPSSQIDQVYDEENIANLEDSLKKLLNPSKSVIWNIELVDPTSTEIYKINDLKRQSYQPTPSQYLGHYKNDDSESIPHFNNFHSQSNTNLRNYENEMHQRCDLDSECKKIGYKNSKKPKTHKHKSSKCHSKVRLSTEMTEEPNLSQISQIDQVYDEENTANLEDSPKKLINPSKSALWNVELVDPTSTEIYKINDLKRQSYQPKPSTSSQYFRYYKNDDSELIPHFNNFHNIRAHAQSDLNWRNYENAMHQRCDLDSECKKIGYKYSKKPKTYKHKSSKCHTPKSLVRRLPSSNDLSDVPTIKKNSEFHPKSIVSILNSNNINDDKIFKFRYSNKDNQFPIFKAKISRKNEMRNSNIVDPKMKRKHPNKISPVPSFKDLLEQINAKKEAGSDIDPRLLKFKYLNKPPTEENTNKLNLDGKDEVPNQNAVDPNILKVIYPNKVDHFPSKYELKRIDSWYDKTESDDKIDQSPPSKAFSNVELQKILDSFKKNVFHSEKTTASDDQNNYMPLQSDITTPTDEKNSYYISKYISHNAEQTDPDADLIKVKYQPVIRAYNKYIESHPKVVIEPKTLNDDSFSLPCALKNGQIGEWKASPISETTTEDPSIKPYQLINRIYSNLGGNNFNPEKSKNPPEPQAFRHMPSKGLVKTLQAPPTNEEVLHSKHECTGTIDEMTQELLSTCDIPTTQATTTQSTIEKSLLKYLNAHEAAENACENQKNQDKAAAAASSKAKEELANKASEASEAAEASVSDKQVIVDLYEELCEILDQVIRLFEPSTAPEEETSQNAVLVSQQHVDSMERALLMAKQIEKYLNQVSEYANDLKEQNEMAVDTSRTRIHILQNKLSTAQESLGKLEEKLVEINECKNRKKKKKFRLFPWKRE